MDVGMIGLGRMGANMAERLRRGGHSVLGFDVQPDVSETASIEDLVSKLAPPRTLWVMVPAGAPAEQTLASLAGACAPGDTVVDGGNSNFRDSIRRAASLKERGIDLLDAGTSGGIWGLDEGFCLMVGGERAAFDRIEPALKTLAPYSQSLTSLTGGRGDYSMHFLRYEEVPAHVAQKVIEETRKVRETAHA